MRKSLLFLVFCTLLFIQNSFGQAIGDYGTNASGNWGSGYTWLVCTTPGTWAGATTTTTQPGQATNVWLRSPHIMTATTSITFNNLTIQNGSSITVGNTTTAVSISCYGNFYIESGGSIYANTPLATNCYIGFYAATATFQINGIAGDDTHGLGVLARASGQSITLTSSIPAPGAAKFSVIKFNSTAIVDASFIFDRDVTVTFTGTAGTGGVGLYTGGDGGTITVNAGKTLTSADKCSISTGSSQSSAPSATPTVTSSSTTFNINGTLNIGSNSSLGNLNLLNAAGFTTYLNVGSTGTINISTKLIANNTTIINVANGGTINFVGASTGNVDCAGASTTMNGTFNFSNTATSGRNLGTATVGGKLIFSDATFPSGISLGTGSQVEYKGSSSYTLPVSQTTYYSLIANNSAGVLLGASTNILESLTVTSGAVSLGNNNITLKSSSPTSTAYFAATAVTAPFTYNGTGLFVCEKYIAGGGSGFPVSGNSKRGYRFMAHPLNAATSLSQIIGASEIAVTGSGGSTNGFTTTGTNNPSAFSYNPNAVNAGTVSGVSSGGPSDPGWTAFTDAAANNWNVGQGIRVFYRGSAAQGLTSADYVVGSATIDFRGQLNIGGASGLDVNLVNGVTGYNLVGNPFASPVNLKNVARTNVSNFIYVFKADQGNRGGYGTVDVSSDYLLPAYAGFFAQATGASPKLTFEEGDKATSQTADMLFRNNSHRNSMKFKLVDANTFWDELEIRMDNAELSVYNNHDAVKFFNPDVNLYSIAADGKYLSIDSRNSSDIVPLGLMATTARSFTLKVDDYNMEQGVELYLVDKFLHTETRIEAGMEYSFSTTSNAGSQGDGRFEIVRKIIAPVILTQPSFAVKAYPNPVIDKLQISFSGTSTEENTAIRIVNANGTIQQTIDAGKVASGIQSIPAKGWAKGIYQVQLINGKNIQTQSIIKL